MATAHLERNTIIGLIVSVLLAAGKCVAGVVGHSSALVADGVESLGDAIGSIVVWHGFRISRRAPNAEHPYGYGRAETVAAFSVGAILMAAAVVIVVGAFGEIVTPHSAPAPWTLLVLLAVIVVKEGLFRLVLRGAERYQSDAARADAWHHRADAITSAVAVVGVSVAVWGPGLVEAPRLVLADEVAAIVASGIILFTGFRLARSAFDDLLDRSAAGVGVEVRRTAERVPGVRLVEKLYARKSGRGVLVDLHLHVDPTMDVRSAHALAGRVKAEIRREHAAVQHVLIHVEPDERAPASPAPREGIVKS